ncbi:MAG: biotin/lipoyl-containing protein, partial [Caulobacteraceae bacterium]
MGEHVVKLPDVGEGVAEAELVEWHVKVGDLVREDAPLAAVMTDKATVEIPSPVDGEVIWVGGEIGDTMAVGAALARLKVDGAGNAKEAPPPAKAAEPEPAPGPAVAPKPEPAPAKPAAKPAAPP